MSLFLILALVLELFGHEHCSLIGSEGLRNTESVDYALLDEVDSFPMGNGLQRNGFDPLGEVIGRGQYESMAL